MLFEFDRTIIEKRRRVGGHRTLITYCKGRRDKSRQKEEEEEELGLRS